MRTVNYSDFLSHVAGLIGVQVTDLSTSELAILNPSFTGAIKKWWQQCNWIELCPYGEARMPGNLLTYANRPDNAAWTATNLTASANAVVNPADGLTTGASLFETTGTGAHSLAQSVFVPAAAAIFGIYVLPAGRTFAKLTFTDSASTAFSAIFNLTTKAITSLSANTAANCYPLSNGWYFISIYFTPAAGTATAALSLGTSASTFSYTGVASTGVYSWLPAVITAQSASGYFVPWEETGADAIESVFDVWDSTPLGAIPSRRVGYQLTQNGIQIINSTSWSYLNYIVTPLITVSSALMVPPGPVYLYYRKRVPNFGGNTYSASTVYTAGQEIYYTANDGTTNYWTCLATTAAGYNPDAYPAYWSKEVIPWNCIEFCAMDVFSDWLLTEGQIGRSQAVSQMAEEILAQNLDQQERQMGFVQPMRVQTHLTSRPIR